MKWMVGLMIALILGGAAVGFDARRRHHEIEQRARWLTAGEPERGRQRIVRYGCGGCHAIPGVPGARGTAAPPLARFGQRGYIAGERRNTPQNLVWWLQHPKQIEPGTAMPEMGVTPADARDIAAYLYTLN